MLLMRDTVGRAAHRWIPHQKLHWMHLVSSLLRKNLSFFISFFFTFHREEVLALQFFVPQISLQAEKISLNLRDKKMLLCWKKIDLSHLLLFVSVGSSDLGWRQIMGTCAPKFTFLGQKGTDFPNLGTQNSTVTFFLRKASKGHKKA